jgi:PII-like signaling protein
VSVPEELAAQRLKVYATEEDEVDGAPLWSWLLERARDQGVIGATVWRGVEGLGRRGRVRSDRFPDAETGLPMVVEVVDRPEAVQGLLAYLVAHAPDTLATLEPVSLLCSAPGRLPAPEPAGGGD